MENLSAESLETNERPQFLKVLCILSFIMCGIMILFALMGLKNLFLSADDIMASNPYLQTLQDNNPTAYQAILDSMQYKNLSAILSLITPIVSLIGVIYMWKLKKMGFFIYIFGELLPYITTILTGGMSVMYASASAFGENGQMAINVFIGLVIIFDVLFIVLYAVNLKHLK